MYSTVPEVPVFGFTALLAGSGTSLHFRDPRVPDYGYGSCSVRFHISDYTSTFGRLHITVFIHNIFVENLLILETSLFTSLYIILSTRN